MISDTHVHTSFSPDSSAPPEDMIKRAAELGMSTVFITDHYDADVTYGDWAFDPDEYFEILGPLKEKYRGTIDVKIGIEIGLQPHLVSHFQKLFSDYPFEYVIGSIHVLDGKDPYYRDEYDMTDDEYFRMYFQYSAECFEACKGLYDTVGHLDYVVRYAYSGTKEYSYEKYAAWIDPILDAAVESGAALEINTGAIKYGQDILHPAEAVVRKYLEKGGRKFTVGSDAHRVRDIGRGFGRAEEYLQSFGVNISIPKD